MLAEYGPQNADAASVGLLSLFFLKSSGCLLVLGDNECIITITVEGKGVTLGYETVRERKRWNYCPMNLANSQSLMDPAGTGRG